MKKQYTKFACVYLGLLLLVAAAGCFEQDNTEPCADTSACLDSEPDPETGFFTPSEDPSRPHSDDTEGS